MRIASVEQVELGNIMELSITGHVHKMGKAVKFSGGLSLSKANGLELEESQSPGSCQAPAWEDSPSMLVITIWEFPRTWIMKGLRMAQS